jgi:hypothetical protein
MKKAFRLLAIFLCAIAISGAAKNEAFQSAKLIDVTTTETLVKGTAYARAQFVVQVGDIVYTAVGGRVHPRGGGPGVDLIVGDPIQASVDGNKLVLIRPGGKEIKANIVRRERAASTR